MEWHLNNGSWRNEKEDKIKNEVKKWEEKSRERNRWDGKGREENRSEGKRRKGKEMEKNNTKIRKGKIQSTLTSVMIEQPTIAGGRPAINASNNNIKRALLIHSIQLFQKRLS